MHPVAGQGFNLTIRDIYTVIKTLAQNEDPGSWSSLNSINKNRKIDQQNIIWFTEGLIHLFSNKELSFLEVWVYQLSIILIFYSNHLRSLLLKMNIKYYDIVIVGAGIVGLSLAASFRNSNLKVALVDKKNILQNKLHNNSDVVALNRASRNVLKNIGVNKDFIESSWSPYSNMFITNQDYTSKINFDTDKILDVSLGYIVNKKN
ncbi:hypothetical protein CF386_01815 [Paraphotobacterium marinum]|uniref:Uncharacterized protein n=1 Tax=Paraphotobacterium marinum TaxID=1755811 RepID=A0A220VBV8_9GAMM|nr:NAD(P)-binding protein [Paraphotobacterium marinum]ASK77877.1 hypothetical protein CF386_01815 [Paraphotobacterium marinum]